MLATLKPILRRHSAIPRPKVPIYIFCYHKVGTKLLGKVFSKICTDFGWKFTSFVGMCSSMPTGYDVVLFNHSLIDIDLIDHPYTAIHLVRDPRDIIVSGYLYHLRCEESWCIHSVTDYSSPIRYPKVPYSQEHKPDELKRVYLETLDGQSYQEKLRSLPQEDGIMFELHHYGSWTIDDMMKWDYSRPNTMELRFEQIMDSFESTFDSIFSHIGFSRDQRWAALILAASEDINRMSDRRILRDDHIASRSTSKWRGYFTPRHKEAFLRRFDDVLQYLGYENSNEW